MFICYFDKKTIGTTYVQKNPMINVLKQQIKITFQLVGWILLEIIGVVFTEIFFVEIHIMSRWPLSEYQAFSSSLITCKSFIIVSQA